MSANARVTRHLTCVCLALSLVLPAYAGGQTPSPTNGREGYDQLVAKYLAEARAGNTVGQAAPGWSWMNGLSMDTRARGLNDLVTIRVVENITATGSADSALTKESDGTASLLNLFGLERKIPKYFAP